MKRHEGALLADVSVQTLEDRIEELEAALQARDDFIATVGHELKNPLTPLLLQAQYLETRLARNPTAEVDRPFVLGKLRGFTARLEQFLGTLDRILDVSRISSNSLQLVPEALDWAEVVQSVVDGMQREFDVAQVSLHLDLEAAPGIWDRLRLEQICFNLLSNALRYGLSRPVHVRLRSTGTWAELTVTDHGLGINPADQATIFERFDRGSAGAPIRAGWAWACGS